ncbi:glycosyltransferase family 2 protein [Humibacter ginsenosidimutans]|uniref:Glycosyltransferase family 2 protein n=1 Tax=Humibacter ginsenosidimutans TaxID=2599293 RepID=A0A5B8M4S1_9MICO|nr:glycosyltransferase family 2 protein [Humibacter ginsenosidimutans]QDZ14989.1 glycosyltransferase family 2 protein [Humibacter ginsenosidimutans]
MTDHETAIDAVSIVIPHYGDPASAQSLVMQLRAQVDAPIMQVIVVDDASPQPFPELEGVQLVRRDRNGGFGAAVNTGMLAAVHDAVLVLNSDLDLPDDFVGDLCRAAAPWMPAVCGCHLTGPDGHDQWAGRTFPRTRHYVIEWLTVLARFRPRLHEAIGHDTRAVVRATVPVDWVVGAVLLMPTELVRSVGGFDEGFHMNCEEVDLQRRLRARGIPSIFLGSVTAVHAGGGSSDDGRRRAWVTHARLRYARKWHEGPGRLRAALTAASVVNLASNGLRRLAGRRVEPVTVFRQELACLRPARTDQASRGRA